MIYLITYELKSNRSYDSFYNAIKSYRGWWHYLDKTWLIKTAESPKSIYDKLKPTLDAADYLLIVKVDLQQGNYFGFLNGDAWDWITKNR